MVSSVWIRLFKSRISWFSACNLNSIRASILDFKKSHGSLMILIIACLSVFFSFIAEETEFDLVMITGLIARISSSSILTPFLILPARASIPDRLLKLQIMNHATLDRFSLLVCACSFKSASTIMVTSCGKETSGFQPRVFMALVGLPKRRSTSAGR